MRNELLIALGLVAAASAVARAEDPAGAPRDCALVEDTAGACLNGDEAACRAEWMLPLLGVAAKQTHDASAAVAAAAGAKPAVAAAVTDAQQALTAATGQLTKLTTAFTAQWARTPYCKRALLLPGLLDIAPELAKSLGEAMQKEEAAARPAASAAAKCDAPLTLCVDAQGQPFDGDELDRVDEDDQLTVLVLSATPADAGALRVTFSIAHNLDTPTRTTGADKTGLGADDTGPHYQVVAQATSEAIPETARAVRVDVQRKAGDDFTRVNRITIPVDHGRYFFEFGLSLTFAYNGTREVIAPAVVEQRTEARGAIGVLYYPWGRDKGRISYLPTLRHSVAVVLATDFDFSTLRKDYHAGIGYSPVAGIAITAGVSLIPGQFLADDLAAPATGPIAFRTHNVLRPFLGVFVTTEFLETASRALTSLRALHK